MHFRSTSMAAGKKLLSTIACHASLAPTLSPLLIRIRMMRERAISGYPYSKKFGQSSMEITIES